MPLLACFTIIAPAPAKSLLWESTIYFFGGSGYSKGGRATRSAVSVENVNMSLVMAPSVEVSGEVTATRDPDAAEMSGVSSSTKSPKSRERAAWLDLILIIQSDNGCLCLCKVPLLCTAGAETMQSKEDEFLMVSNHCIWSPTGVATPYMLKPTDYGSVSTVMPG